MFLYTLKKQFGKSSCLSYQKNKKKEECRYNSAFLACSTRLFYKQHSYKQRQTEIGKKLS